MMSKLFLICKIGEVLLLENWTGKTSEANGELEDRGIDPVQGKALLSNIEPA